MNITILETDVYAKWFHSLADITGKRIINTRIRRLSIGLAGDSKYVGKDILELRIHHGPGYRVYCDVSRQTITILLAGGDKSTQQADIVRAMKIAAEVRENDFEID
jgi:putative addiction module killer protein